MQLNLIHTVALALMFRLTEQGSRLNGNYISDSPWSVIRLMLKQRRRRGIQ